MQFPTQCIPCMIERAIAFAHAKGDEQTAWEYLRQCLRAIADAPEGVASPYLNVTFFGDIARQFYDIADDPYAEEKADSNAFMLARKDWLRERIMQDPDPLQRALCIARTANYIDFSALRGQVSFEKLDAMLLGAENDCLGPEYERLLEELEGAKELLYLCDNAGEIVADALVAEVLRQQYPSLRLTFCVRAGRPPTTRCWPTPRPRGWGSWRRSSTTAATSAARSWRILARTCVRRWRGRTSFWPRAWPILRASAAAAKISTTCSCASAGCSAICSKSPSLPGCSSTTGGCLVETNKNRHGNLLNLSEHPLLFSKSCANM